MTPFGRILLGLAFCGAAGVAPVVAQSNAAGATESGRLAVQYDAAGSFGHTSGWSSGVEVDYRLSRRWEGFVEIGRVSDVSTAEVERRAGVIATAVGASSAVKQPAVYYDLGLRYSLGAGGWRPFVLIGAGAARVNTTATFTRNGANITSQLPSFGVRLGSDLSGGVSKALLTVGGGVSRSLKTRYFVEASYRYGRILGNTGDIQNDTAASTNRLQVGFGLRF